MYVYTVWSSWQADPKSMTLICGDWSLIVRDFPVPGSRFQENVLRLQVTVDKPRVLENSKTLEELLSKDAH